MFWFPHKNCQEIGYLPCLYIPQQTQIDLGAAVPAPASKLTINGLEAIANRLGACGAGHVKESVDFLATDMITVYSNEPSFHWKAIKVSCLTSANPQMLLQQSTCSCHSLARKGTTEGRSEQRSLFRWVERCCFGMSVCCQRGQQQTWTFVHPLDHNSGSGTWFRGLKGITVHELQETSDVKGQDWVAWLRCETESLGEGLTDHDAESQAQGNRRHDAREHVAMTHRGVLPAKGVSCRQST